MRIKSLQVHGFKSFVDKVVFTFDDGVTAVVGPNGCGKSNVVDAVRWVMGEQSPKRLRGKGMEDVIFAGSETRPPIGMAEVVLTFDCSDGDAPAGFSEYSEVEITRRLYRSGESEYLLNKTPCRLRDVQDFFRDTGVGLRGYTIVEQGRIAEIVSAKADERRVLIEEAAGISKYKARRREAESKIASTETNLDRVNDILGEIRRQISSLERQARKAARYKRLRETQRVLDLSIAADERREMMQVVEQARANLSNLRDQVTALQTNLSERELHAEEQRIALTETEKLVARCAEALYTLRSEIKQIEGQVELNRRETEGLEESNSGRADEIAQLREQLAAARSEAEDAQAELLQLDEALANEGESVRGAEQEAREALEVMRAIERDREVENEAFVGVLTAFARAEDRGSAVEDRRAEVDQRMR
ncbi:MAG: AAA family ATPase, partial [Deltaproteobacteria bacterium]|nr:AAA family ATPase [Deltaproteobacteria bacterium]